MDTINIIVGETPQNIALGRRGEHLVTEVVFDISAFLEEFEYGDPQLIIKRPDDTEAYFVTITQEDNLVTWLVTSTDTDQVGQGKAELFWYVDDRLAKSVIYSTWVDPDIGNTGGTPIPPPTVNVPDHWVNGFDAGAVRLTTATQEEIPLGYRLGSGSVAEGARTKASGNYSHAEGEHTEAKSWYTHVEGQYTIANHRSQHVFGEFNAEDTSSASSYDRGTYIEIVGCGASAAYRRNARTLDWDGNEELKGSITLGKGTADEVTLTATQLKALLALL